MSTCLLSRRGPIYCRFPNWEEDPGPPFSHSTVGQFRICPDSLTSFLPQNKKARAELFFPTVKYPLAAIPGQPYLAFRSIRLQEVVMTGPALSDVLKEGSIFAFFFIILLVSSPETLVRVNANTRMMSRSFNRIFIRYLQINDYFIKWQSGKFMRSSNKLKTISSESPSSNSKSKLQASFSLKRLNTIVTEKLAQGYKYDKMLFHKTIFHLRPLGDNPELFTREISLTSQVMSALKYKQANHSKAVLPHPVTVKFGLDRVHGRSKMLRDDTLSHITAKKWLIYNMESGMIVKGYKYRQPHDVASLSKLLTFYTAYDIIRQYFIVASTFEILILPSDSKVAGTMLKINTEEQNLISLQDAFHALLMMSANNIANSIANNLGSYLIKQSQGRYFSCFDLIQQSRQVNINAFLGRMKKLAKEIGLKESTITSPHGLNGNISSALDIARLSAECFKIPLFYKIATTKRIPIKVRLVDEHGELANRVYLIENTNKLLGKGCLGGKTGSSIAGGQSFLGAYPGSLVIIVLGSAGREQRFHDWLRLGEWVSNKLTLTSSLNLT